MSTKPISEFFSKHREKILGESRINLMCIYCSWIQMSFWSCVIFLNYYFVHISTNVKNIYENHVCFEKLMLIYIGKIIPLFDCNILLANHWNFTSSPWRCSVKITVLKQKNLVKLSDVSVVKNLLKITVKGVNFSKAADL